LDRWIVIPKRKDRLFRNVKNFSVENRFHPAFLYLCVMKPKALVIVAQVRRLYQRYGIKSVTMDDIAMHLNISKKTIYEHFTDKEDLVRHILMFEHDARCSRLAAIEEHKYNAVEELFEVYKMINSSIKEYNPSMEYDVRKYYPDLFTKIREVKRKRMYESSYSNMNKGKREGLYRKDLNSKIIAKLHVFRTENLLDNDMFTQEELASFKMFHEIFVYHLQGILSHEGRTFFENNFEKFKATLA
jgi:TetR/AcrR family transcriptional regulator, cholesterol catabolism regulator